MKPKKAHIIILIVVMGMALLSAVLVSSLAIWTETYEDDKTARIPVSPFNPTAKHIVFVPLDASGNIISDNANAMSYAAVGYTGLVGEVEIPATHQPEGYDEKPVTAVLIDDNNTAVAFTESAEFITSLILPASIVRIGAGVFSGFENLTSVLIRDTVPPSVDPPNVVIGDFAFAYTLSLTSFLYPGHTFVGNFNAIFYESAFNPQ